MPEFPKTLYVRRENEPDEDGYIVASVNADAGVEEGDTQNVAIYELKQVVEVSWMKNVTITPVE